MRPINPPLTAADVAALLSYCPVSGVLLWKQRVAKNIFVGDVAGRLDKSSGYVRVRIQGPEIAAHRVAWILSYGEWPTDLIDHINGNRADNRLENLREANYKVNAMNRKARSGQPLPLGVSASSRGKYLAGYKEAGQYVQIGHYETPEEAARAYLAELDGRIARAMQ